MTKQSQKDFGPIADDYSFFEQHATEADSDAQAYAVRLGDVSAGGGAIRMLDFGCGSGTFTERLLRLAGWPAGRLRLTLVEPVESVRREAVERLAGFSAAPIVDSATLPTDATRGFEFVLANHVLYYVDDVRRSVAALVEAVAPSGVLATAIAGRANALIEIWIAAFALVGREVPYHTSEDVEAALVALGAPYEKESVPYELAFADSEENRMRIIRFLLAEHLDEMPAEALVAMFDRYSSGGEVRVRTASDHYTVRGR
ncbi:MAG: methyltransferase domain-containing protein [Pirellulales bacterium]|nr:methyltransferase domain-containing protein [Pirellulales bacterium]